MYAAAIAFAYADHGLNRANGVVPHVEGTRIWKRPVLLDGLSACGFHFDSHQESDRMNDSLTPYAVAARPIASVTLELVLSVCRALCSCRVRWR